MLQVSEDLLHDAITVAFCDGVLSHTERPDLSIQGSLETTRIKIMEYIKQVSVDRKRNA